ncbi:MAG: hypothetical protein WD101_02750 [Gemmatimonadota bacterium]
MRTGLVALCLALTAGCTLSSGPAPGSQEGASTLTDGPLPPPGHGTLSQRDVSITLRSGDLQLMVTPLAPSVLVATAPDTYRRLDALAAPHRARPEAPSLFLVSFFSDRPEVRFVPEEVQLVSRGMRARPIDILPITPGWGAGRVAQRDTETAIYMFDRSVDLESDLVLHYGLEQVSTWAVTLTRIQAERARARARATGATPGHSSSSYFEILR